MRRCLRTKARPLKNILIGPRALPTRHPRPSRLPKPFLLRGSGTFLALALALALLVTLTRRESYPGFFDGFERSPFCLRV